MKRLALFSFGFVLVASGGCAFAQGTIYKQTTPDGRIVYSDKVLPDGRVQKEIGPETELTTPAPPLVTPREAQQADQRISRNLSRNDELWLERNRAQAELDKARRMKVDGEEPLAGERQGTTSGRSRLNESYWQRQDALERNLDRAQLRLEQAERALRDAGS